MSMMRVCVVAPQPSDGWYDGRYKVRHLNGRKVYEHRLLMEQKLGRRLRTSEYVDHVDGNKLNNALENLRLATPSDNVRNQRKAKNNTSGFRGVCWDAERQKWMAKIANGGRTIFLGRFDSARKAAKAFDDAARKFFGGFARLNFPRDGERSV